MSQMNDAEPAADWRCWPACSRRPRPRAGQQSSQTLMEPNRLQAAKHWENYREQQIN
jgi:hypothetical protein